MTKFYDKFKSTFEFKQWDHTITKEEFEHKQICGLTIKAVFRILCEIYFRSFRLTEKGEGGGVSTTHMCRNDPTAHICLKLDKNEPIFEIKIFQIFSSFQIFSRYRTIKAFYPRYLLDIQNSLSPMLMF